MRLAWFYGNPNETATLIGLIMVASWAFWTKTPRSFRLILAINFILSIPLFATASRGGIVATGIALLTLALFHGVPRGQGQRRWLSGILIGGILVGLFSLSAKRFSKGISDASIQNRWEIWKHTPQMMVDAPQGWHNAAQAYHHYYQPLHQTQRYRHLVCSHLTWLVEFSWFERALYLGVWITGLLLFISGEGRVRVAGIVWFCFAIHASFSHVAEEWTLWLIPAILSLYATTRPDFSMSRFLNPRSMMIGLLLTSLSLGLIGGLGKHSFSRIEQIDSHVVLIHGEGDPIGLLNPQKEILGDSWGHFLRESSSSWMVSKATDRTILCGKFPQEDLSMIQSMVWLNPQGDPPFQAPSSQGIIIRGEFFYPAQKEIWIAWVKQHPGWTFQEIAGARDYISRWREVAESFFTAK